MKIDTRVKTFLYHQLVIWASFGIVMYALDMPWLWFIECSLIWCALGYLTGKMRFVAYKRVAYAYISIPAVNVVSVLGMWLLFTNQMSGHPHASALFWAGFILTVAEYAMFDMFRFFVFEKIPYFYEPYPLSEEAKVATAIDAELTNEEKLMLSYIREYPTVEDSLAAINLYCPQVRVDTERLNDCGHLTERFMQHNKSMQVGDRLLCHFTPFTVEVERMRQALPPVIFQVVFIFKYIWKRIFPKCQGLMDIYYFLTKGKNRSLHPVELLGRMYKAGFEIIFTDIAYDEFYAYVRKKSEPLDTSKASLGPVVRMKRVGYKGERVGIYKMRTMYVFSEYLQAYLYEKSHLVKGDKIADDYRITRIGAFMRKCWIDELPQLFNLIRGDIKLVGVRPLSEHKYSLYSKELQELRIKVKPGIIPPYYVDMPESLEEMEESERRYTEAYLKAPFKTDWIYFWRAFRNIVFRGARSK